jgi:small multidrug resistance pump
MTYFYLAIAIVSESIATSALKASKGFTRLVPSVLVAAGYLCAFYFLNRVLETVPVGIVNALWAGLGIVLVAALGVVLYREKLDWAAILGMAMIMSGVAIMHLFSKAVRQ